MQISPSLISPVATPTRGAPTRAASGADTAGFASLLRQTVQPPTPEPAPVRTPTAAPVTPPARPPAPVSTNPSGASADKAPTPSSDAPDAADRSADAPPDAATAATTTKPGTPALARGALRARATAADARSRVNATTTDEAGAAGTTPGTVRDRATEAAHDKARPSEAHSTGGPGLDPTTLPRPLPASPAAAPALPSDPSTAQDDGGATRALVTRGAAERSAVGGLDSIGASASSSTGNAAVGAEPTAGRGADAGRETGASSATNPLANDSASTAALPTTTPPPGSAFAGLLAEHRQSADTGGAPRAASAVDGNAAASGASAFAAAPVFGTTAPRAAEVAAPVGSPDFAQQLGVQVSVLAKDGVQHAELHLNPADMGPVSVQITMDGTQARIDFGAEVAATRHAIESGLPQLASALADAGFTLAGGGVSQHGGGSSGRGQPGGGSPASGSRATEGVTAAAAVSRRVATVGGLDLYA